MSRKEVPRPGLVRLAVAGQITTAQGAQSAHLSIRQFQRLKARYRSEGIPGLRHRLPAKHRRRPRPYRRRRSPALRMGALVLLDGSQFAWLETRGPTMTLLGAIDDATGTVVAMVFRPAEDLHGYVTLLAQLATRHGLPLVLYGDRLNVFVRNDRHWSLDEELQGAQHPTQFGRILRELGIGFILAGSPQAKSRIERLWRTLQDRLVVELRLAGVRTPEGATAFLPAFLADFNRRFAHPAAHPTPVWRRPPADFATVLSCRYRRTVATDTPSISAAAGSNSSAARPGGRMPASTSKRGNASTVGCWSTAPGASAWPCSRGPAPILPSGPPRPGAPLASRLRHPPRPASARRPRAPRPSRPVRPT